MARPRLLVLVGQKFGRLTVLSDAGNTKDGRTNLSTWWVRCECRTKKKVVGSHLVTGRIKSCGCGRGSRSIPVEVPEGQSYCWKCCLVKEAKFFYKNSASKTGLNSQCIECYRKRTPRQQVQLLKTRRAWTRRLREEAIAHYGGECRCCGETVFEFLAIDHVNGGGRSHRKEINTGNMAWWLKKNNYPKGFRVLCHNCNMARGIYGYCPHEDKIVLG